MCIFLCTNLKNAINKTFFLAVRLLPKAVLGDFFVCETLDKLSNVTVLKMIVLKNNNKNKKVA